MRPNHVYFHAQLVWLLPLPCMFSHVYIRGCFFTFMILESKISFSPHKYFVVKTKSRLQMLLFETRSNTFGSSNTMATKNRYETLLTNARGKPPVQSGKQVD